MREFLVLHTDDRTPGLCMKIVNSDDMITAIQIACMGGVEPRNLWACVGMEKAWALTAAVDNMLKQPAYIQMKRLEQRG